MSGTVLFSLIVENFGKRALTKWEGALRDQIHLLNSMLGSEPGIGQPGALLICYSCN